MTDSAAGREEIVIGIIRNAAGEVLVSRRREGTHLEGRLEFPGGKVGPGESRFRALARELREEAGIRVDSAHPLMRFDHDYPGKKLSLSAWVVDRWSGEARAREGQPLDWMAPADLSAGDFPQANARILRIMGLPPLYLITPDLEHYDAAFLRRVEAFMDNGLGLIQFRSKSSRFEEHAGIVRELVKLGSRKSCEVLYNGTPAEAERLGAHGVHLSAAGLALHATRPLPSGMRVAVSCHNRGELDRAARIEADFCVLSPVGASPSHPGSAGIGWEAFAAMADGAGVPVYALGGMQAGDLAEARRRGAHGIAMISGIWDATAPSEIILDLCRRRGPGPARG